MGPVETLSSAPERAIFTCGGPEWRNWQTQQTQKPASFSLQTYSPILNITHGLSRAVSTCSHACASLLILAHRLVTDKLKPGAVLLNKSGPAECDQHSAEPNPQTRGKSGTRQCYQHRRDAPWMQPREMTSYLCPGNFSSGIRVRWPCR